ncbi:UDP-glycosyltransferase 83A1-like [Camellia sinensis]|uniref:UDP-glycosyltransferase 83A1-like n=1 Tax=Camellia sinensis TaxID=4442 RepID=UPI0010356A53|nr:UDP-glycosyltransferase 83A1-like [Camellia sinensis]
MGTGCCREMGIRRAAFWPAVAAVLALEFSIPELLGDGIINNNGTPIKNQMIQLSPTMPAIHASKLVWACIRDLATNKAVFEMVSRNKKSVKVANWLICNSAFELSFTVFDYNKFQELALGIELTNRPFLWVVRPDLNHDHGKDLNHDHAFPNGFRDRAPSHPSVACFLSHCGWNFIIEGVSNGVPFLCWPYFADQFLTRPTFVMFGRLDLLEIS